MTAHPDIAIAARPRSVRRALGVVAGGLFLLAALAMGGRAALATADDDKPAAAPAAPAQPPAATPAPADDDDDDRAAPPPAPAAHDDDDDQPAAAPAAARDDDDAPAAGSRPADDDDAAAGGDDDDDEGGVTAPQRVFLRDGIPVIRLDEATAARSGIETEPQRRTSRAPAIRAFASVLDLDPMMELASQIVTAHAAVTSAEARIVASKGAYDRAKTLYENNQVIPMAQLQAAEAIYRADDATLLSTQTQLRSSLTLARQEWGEILGKQLEDQSGTVGDLMNRTQVLLKVSMPPDQRLATPPDKASVEFSDGGRADISFLSRATEADPRIQGTAFFYLAPADTGLQPGMTLAAAIPNGEKIDGVRIPASAVVWWQGSAWVYLKDRDSFFREHIAASVLASDGGFLEEGLPQGLDIVVQGAEALLTEEFRSQIQIDEDEGK